MVLSPVQVEQRLNAISEGLRLESPVQGWVYLEEYQNGIDEYLLLAKPTAKDDRWLGVCYQMQADWMRAQEAYYRAIARGEQAARIELARVLSFLDRDEEAAAELGRVELASLSTADKVLWYRAKSIQEESLGSLQEAIMLAEEAWRLVQGIPEFPFLAPWVLIRLGNLHGQAGRSRRALWCFERALEITDGSICWNLRLLRAELLTDVGCYEEALGELEALDIPDTPKPVRSLRLRSRADIAWATGDVRGALEWYSQAIEQALEDEASNTELYARLSMAALLGYRGAIEASREQLARAQLLLSSKRDRLNYRFREVLLEYWDGGDALQTSARLQALLADFAEMDLLREQGWVRLHLAEVYRNMGDSRYLGELDTLQALSVALQNRAFLEPEWILVPQLREAARLTHPKIAGDEPAVLEIYTLGQEKLVLGGQIVNIRLRRAVEVIAFFLEYREVSLKRLRAEVFADEEPQAARNYFHQLRHELHERLPGLLLEYDPASRVYRLESRLQILWDVAELRAGRRMGELGIFLPGSGSDWANHLDHELEPLRGEAAAKVMPQWHERMSAAVPRMQRS